MPSSDLLIVGVTPRHTTASSVPDPSWKCETEGCLDPVFVDGYIEGNQYRWDLWIGFCLSKAQLL